MPVYNGQNFIREALDSLLAQTFSDYELIISDNASTDATETICREYAAKDGRIRYIRQTENIGAINNFKYVVVEATGIYFAWLAHDDLLESEFVQKCVNHLHAHKDCVLVSGEFRKMDEVNSVTGITNMKNISYEIPWKSRVQEFFVYPISEVFFCIYGLARRDVLVEALNSIRYGPLLAGSELPLLSRIAVRGHIDSLSHILRVYRFHSGSAYHAELSSLSGPSIRGRLLQYYNLWWNRLDQILVLLSSCMSFSLKIRTFNKVLFFYARRLIWVIKKVPGFLRKKFQ